MLPIKRQFLRHSIKERAHLSRHVCGVNHDASALLRANEEAGNFITPGAKSFLENKNLVFLREKFELLVAFATPRELGFQKPTTPPMLFARGLELGLAAVPDTLAFEPQEFSYMPTNRKPYLYAVRHFDRRLSWVFPQIIPVDDPVYAISWWHGQTPVDTDIPIGFAMT